MLAHPVHSHGHHVQACSVSELDEVGGKSGLVGSTDKSGFWDINYDLGSQVRQQRDLVGV